jgi:hypothetical protein
MNGFPSPLCTFFVTDNWSRASIIRHIFSSRRDTQRPGFSILPDEIDISLRFGAHRIENLASQQHGTLFARTYSG